MIIQLCIFLVCLATSAEGRTVNICTNAETKPRDCAECSYQENLKDIICMKKKISLECNVENYLSRFPFNASIIDYRYCHDELWITDSNTLNDMSDTIRYVNDIFNNTKKSSLIAVFGLPKHIQKCMSCPSDVHSLYGSTNASDCLKAHVAPQKCHENMYSVCNYMNECSECKPCPNGKISPEGSTSIYDCVDFIDKSNKCGKNSYSVCNKMKGCLPCMDCPQNMISELGSTNIMNCTNSSQSFIISNKTDIFLHFENWPRKHSLGFRKNSFDSDTQISIKIITNYSIFPPSDNLGKYDILELKSSDSSHFKVPVVLTLGYTENIEGMTPVIETFDEVAQEWVKVSTNLLVNMDEKTVSVEILHFSYWRPNMDEITVSDIYNEPKKYEDTSFAFKLNLFMLFIMCIILGISTLIIYKLRQKSRFFNK